MDFESLPDLKGAVLVKGIGFEVSDSDISGQDIFARLVPLEAHAASSLYSEEKARLLREVGDVIEEKGVELAVFLSSMKLEEVPNPGDHISLPQEVIECAASLSAKDNAVDKLTDAMDRIAQVSADVETSLKEIKTILDSEEEQQKEYEIIVGQRPASGLSAELTHEYTKNHKAHSMASDSNATLHRAMKLHIDNLKLLSLPLPVLQSMVASMVDIDEDSEAAITEMQTMIQKVEEMRMQRAMLCESLREDILSDDITKKLVQYKDENMSQIFAEELKKHDAKKRLIEQNICAQANILSALTEANAKYAETRRIGNVQL